MPPPPIIWTIGHSNRSFDDFLALLRAHRIDAVCDVRRQPVSSRHPHFSRRELEPALRDSGVGYHWLVELGGMRTARPGTVWPPGLHEAFCGYADHLATPEFARGIQRLCSVAATSRTACMCAESEWRDCHRSILSDALTAAGASVLHIRTADEPEPHTLTRGARLDGGRVTFPAERQGTLF